MALSDLARRELGLHRYPATPVATTGRPCLTIPKNGLVYIPTMVFPVAFLEPTEDKDRLPGQGMWNVGFDRIANVPPHIANLDEVLDKQFTGQLVAWDPLRQEARWAGTVGRPSAGGVLSTDGGLVYQASGDGHLTAYDASTGEALWAQDTQTGAMAAPITYAIDGQQYIALAVGFGGGLASEGGPVAHGWKVPNLSRVLVYRLGGQEQLPPVPENTRTMPKPAPVTASASVVERGKVVYHRHCGYCHGDGLRTGGFEPRPALVIG